MADTYWRQAAAAGLSLFGLRGNLLTTRVQHVTQADHLERFRDAVAVRVDADRIPDRSLAPQALASLVS